MRISICWFCCLGSTRTFCRGWRRWCTWQLLYASLMASINFCYSFWETLWLQLRMSKMPCPALARRVHRLVVTRRDASKKKSPQRALCMIAASIYWNCGCKHSDHSWVMHRPCLRQYFPLDQCPFQLVILTLGSLLLVVFTTCAMYSSFVTDDERLYRASLFYTGHAVIANAMFVCACCFGSLISSNVNI